MAEESIEYTVRKSKRARRLRLAVYCDESVVITAPEGVRLSIIQDFVVEKRHWIYEKWRYFRSIDTKAIRTFSNDDYLKYKEQARELAMQRVEYFSQRIDFKYSKINIKNQKTRWGSCSKKGNLNFNYRIIFLPEVVRDYVIVHEICHLLEFSHSKKYWNLIHAACPNYKNIIKQLKEFDLYYK